MTNNRNPRDSWISNIRKWEILRKLILYTIAPMTRDRIIEGDISFN
jgi:hypothetical protein